MNYNFTVTVPKNTAQATPYTKMLVLTAGVIRKMIIRIPPGHADLTGLVLKYHETQIYPLNPGEYYHGDDEKIDFEEYMPILVNPYELKAEAWNSDDTYAHDFIINITVIRPDELERPIPSSSIAAIAALIGAEKEV